MPLARRRVDVHQPLFKSGSPGLQTSAIWPGPYTHRIPTMADVILLNDTSDWYHHGCYFASRGLKDLIRAKHHLKDSVPILDLIPRKPVGQGMESLDLYALERFVEANDDLFRRIRNVDLVIVNGEGSIHGERRYVWTLFSVLVAAKRLLSKDVHLVNHSAYPHDVVDEKGSDLEATYRFVYEMLDYVAVRETFSHRLLSRMGISSELSFDCSVLALPRIARDGPRKKRIVLGGSPSSTISGLERVLEFVSVIAARGWECRFLYGANSSPAADDQRLLQEARDLGRDLEVAVLETPERLAEEIASAGALVSGRFHYSIAAYVLGTPFAMLGSNTPKNRALSEMLRVPAPIAWTDPHLSQRLEATLEGFGRPASDSDFERLRDLARRNVI